MATDAELEIHRALRDAQHQQVYFLLGAAGAAIAFAVTRTQGASLSWSQLPLGMAVLCWGTSFYLGCRNRRWVSAGLHTNGDMYDVRAGRHPLTGTNPEAMAIGLKVLRENFEHQSNRANWTLTWQFRLLVSGAIFYISWHVLEMGLRLRG